MKNSPSTPLRVGILGCGGMALAHADRIARHAGATLAAVCDVDETITSRFQALLDEKQLGSPRPYHDPAKMYSDGGINAVVIVTPHTLHYHQAVQALDAGCHVLMEKPMVTEVRDAYALSEHVAAADKTFAIGFNTPCRPAFQYLRDVIRNGTLGKLELASGWLSQGWLKGTIGKWRQDPALSGGGQAYDSGAHLLISFVWTIESPVQTVFAFIDNCGSPVDINSAINIRFDNGVFANLSVSGNCPSDSAAGVFIFDEGRIEIDPWSGSWIKVWKGKEEIQPVLEAGAESPTHDFLDAVLNNREPATSVRQGILHSELMDAIYRSGESGRAWRRSEHPEASPSPTAA